uniref:Putative secreted protein n=1 Tax=Ixodes ricinus TaxID=34613 RepID=A0A147BEW2_IXORI
MSIISWIVVAVRAPPRMASMSLMNCTVVMEAGRGWPALLLCSMFTSTLLVCCSNTLLSPSYVQLASLSLRRSPSPDTFK